MRVSSRMRLSISKINSKRKVEIKTLQLTVAGVNAAHHTRPRTNTVQVAEVVMISTTSPEEAVGIQITSPEEAVSVTA